MEIMVFEQNGSGRHKVAGIERFGSGITITEIIAIDSFLPDFIEDPGSFLSSSVSADLVLDYLTHPDLSHHLVRLCREKNIPVISSGKKNQDAITPFTCCGLGQHKGLGAYGDQFGFPVYEVVLEGDKIMQLHVVRGAPCGATWEILTKVMGVDINEAMSLLPREIQYLCTANPSRFDPISGKSPVHYAGYVHRAALQKAIDKARQR